MDEENKTFKYGTLVISCAQCGNETVLEDMVQDGRAVYLFNVEGNSLKLHCPVCDITMEMSIKPSKNVPEDDLEELEDRILDDDFMDPSSEELPEGVTEEYIPNEEFSKETVTEEIV
jgi:hypothetical protein